MRLTLRTLLAYLDDTLTSSEIKTIGEKVAESDAAQELIARIKLVTRRRRLTTPPLSGPGSIDPNDAAEYLDNTLPGDQVSELEKQCLESDVHLAEISACHQILTLVLGEPALVPPTARERMYGLVKGKESIPYRKATPSRKTSPDGLEDEETLGLSGGWLRWALPAAGVLLVAALGLAISQVLDLGRGDKRQAGNTVTARDKDKDNEARPRDRENKGNGASGKDLARAADKDGKSGTDGRTDKDKGKDGNGKPPEKDKGTKGGPSEDTEPPPPPIKRPAPPDRKSRMALASFAGSYNDLPGVLVTRKAGATDLESWQQVGRGQRVHTTDTLVSLPGFANIVRTNSGVSLLMRGNVREFALDGMQELLLDSAVVMHKPAEKDIALDLTLLRGRIYLTNRKESGPAKIRLRFHEREVWDVTLSEPGDEVAADYFQAYTHEINHRDEEPRALLFLMLLRGEATVQVNDVESYTKQANPPRSICFTWDSFRKAGEPVEVERPEPRWSKLPPTPDLVRGERLNSIREMNTALRNLEVRLNAKKPVDIAIKEGLSNESPMARGLAIYCLGAIDDVARLVDVMGDEDSNHAYDRATAIFTLRQWLSRGSAQAKVLYNDKTQTGVLIDKKYTQREARSIADLLFDLPVETWRKQETYEALARCLQSPRVAIADLGYSHLLHLAPGLKLPGFNAASPREDRKKFADQIFDLIEKKKLPPQPPERKDDPKGGSGK